MEDEEAPTPVVRRLGAEPGDSTLVPTFAPEFHPRKPVELSNKPVLRVSLPIATP